MNAQTKQEAVAGGDIDTYCGKCRLTLAHVVVATDAGKAVRVLCKTCKSEHNVRRTPVRKAASERAPRAKGTRASSAKPSQERAERRAEEAFEAARQGRDLAGAKRYRPQEVVDVGDVIDHPTFGLGVVLKLLSDAKAQIIFQRSGERVLIFGRN